MLELSTERHRTWLAAISRADLTKEKLSNVFVCGCHFTKGWLKIIIFLTMFLVQEFYVGAPSNIMHKSDVGWFPCLSLGHEKVDMATLQAADERATQTEERRKRMAEAYARASESSEVNETNEDEEMVTCSEETQTIL